MRFTTRFTRDFVLQNLPDGCRRILEIGAGEGDLAAALAAGGFEVVALDDDPACVATARANGVDARTARWPDFSGGRFDAVLFTRSLHHMEDLAACVRAAADSLQAGGRLLVEDFAREEADAASVAWFADALRRQDPTGALAADEDLRVLLAAADPLEAWRAQHDHDLHCAAAQLAALGAVFATVAEAGCPYYFRYLARAGDETAVKALAHEEASAIAAGAIRPLGRRFVAGGRG